MKKILTILAFGLMIKQSIAQISITSLSTPYTQDFNTLAASGTSSALPVGWAMSTSTYLADNGSNTSSGTTYSLGSSGNTERAFGSFSTNATQPKFGVQFTNNSGLNIVEITISYKGEQWRLSTAGRADRLDFQYSTTATGINSGTYTDFNALDFSSPTTTGATGILNGNLPANQATVTSTISSLNIANGASFWLRWDDLNISGVDDHLGIDDITISFSNTDNTPPTVTSLTPADNATNILTNANLQMVFNEAVNIGTGNILVKKLSDNSIVETIDVTGGAVVISPSNTASITRSVVLANNTAYYIEMPAGAFTDIAANNYAGISGTTTWNFTTLNPDVIPPTITTLTPSNNATNVPQFTTLQMVFSENIAKGSGNIVIKKISDNSVFQTINVGNANVAVSSATATITINTLDINTNYYIEIDAGTFTDIALNNFAGITGNSTWNFTTIPLPAAGIVGNNYSFTSCTSTFIIEGWRQYSVTGTQAWTCTASGRTGADGIEMNAFVSSGNNPLNQDWLISPPFDLTTTNAPTLKFYSKGDFASGNGLVVKVSTNYVPGTNPTSATWTDVLTFPVPTSSNSAWALNDNIDLSAYNTSNVYVAWFYSNPSTANSSRWRIDDVIIYGNIVLPPCDEPTDQPTNLTLTPTATSVSGTFTAAAPAPSGYIVIRSTSSTLSATPTDGTAYTVGTALGGGTVIANGSGTSFIDNGLTATTPYYYFVFAYNNENCTGGANYNVTLNAPNGNTATTTTLALAPCVQPTAAPTALNLSATNTTISGSFTTSSSTNRYLIVISTTTPLGTTPTDGVTYTAGSAFGTGTVVSYGSSNTFNASGLTANTPYYIFVFAANGDCTGEPDYFATSLNGSISTTNGTGVPTGYYDAAIGLTCQPLKTALKTIISTGTQVLSYTPGLWNLYPFSDKRRNDANTADILWDTYSDNPTGAEPYTYTLVSNQCGSYSTEGQCYNREHSTPQSWFNEVSPMVSDAHHIFPTDGKVNAMHSNYPYGEVQNLTVFPSGSGYNNPSLAGSKLGTGSNYGFTGTVFEPIDEYKGDYARAFLYMAVRYEDEMISQNWTQYGRANEAILSAADQPNAAIRRLQFYDDWYIKLLYKWHIQDPVSAKEIARNNVIYSQLVTDGATQKRQGNRNPFIDHPEYVVAIWGTACLAVLPVTITNLSAKKINTNALISWKVGNEQSIVKYEIERSINRINFEKIGEVSSNGNTLYTYTDNNLPKTERVYYRLKTVELIGKSTITNIVSVEGDRSNTLIKIFPNPANEKITVQLNTVVLSTATLVTITDVTGRVLLQQNIMAGQSAITIPVATFSKGMYTLKITSNKNSLQTTFIISR
jgi:endonuclease I